MEPQNNPIQELNTGRLLLSAKDIQKGFLISRGLAISRTTLDIWEGRGLDVRHIGGRKWYSWELTWGFYLNGASKPKKAS